jgi:hypothetical protein
MDVAVIVDDIDRAQQTDNRHAQPLSPRGVREYRVRDAGRWAVQPDGFS